MHSTKEKRISQETNGCPANWSDDAEKNVLGSILLLPSTLDNLPLLPADFHDEAHRTVYAAMLHLHREGSAIDVTLLADRLQADGTYKKIGEAPYLAEIAQSVPTAHNATYYASIVRKLSRKRRLAGLLADTSAALTNGQTVDNVLLGLDANLYEFRREGQPQERIEPRGIAELMADYHHLREPIIDGWIRRGETANVIAAPKVGKSWLAYCIALSVATGAPIFGAFGTKRGRVLLIDNELFPETITQRIKTVAEAMELRPEDYADNLEVLSLRGRLIDLHGIDSLLRNVEAGTYDLVILDALYRAIPEGASENDNAQVALLFNLIDSMARRMDCAWLNVHHSSKGNQGEKSVTDVGSGAGSQARAADAHIVLRQHEEDNAVTLDAVVRSFPPVEPLALRWCFPLWLPADDLDAGKLAGRLNRNEQLTAKRDREGIQEIIKALREGPATLRELRRRTGGMGKGRCEKLVYRLQADGHVQSEMVKVKGNECQQYTLIEDVVRE